MENEIRIQDYNLHDAKLSKIEYCWKSKILKIFLNAYLEYPESNELTQVCLSLYKVRDIHIPQKEDWGPSNYVNDVSEAEGKYSIEMQSGDMINIEADEFLITKIEK